MIRYAVLLLNMLGLFIYQLFLADGVTVTQSVPADMKPGSEYTVELTISKGTTGGFAKLQQELPDGFTATAMESKGASFTFSGNAVKFIWTSLPSEAEFKITYKVTLAATAPTGEKTVTGKILHYVADNAKQSVEIPGSKINVSSEKPLQHRIIQLLQPAAPRTTGATGPKQVKAARQIRTQQPRSVNYRSP